MLRFKTYTVAVFACFLVLNGCVAFSHLHHQQHQSHLNSVPKGTTGEKAKGVTKLVTGKLPTKAKNRPKQKHVRSLLPKKGAVLFSMTTSGPDFHANPILMYRHVSQDIYGQVPMLNIFNDQARSSFTNAYGALKLLVLKPGIYEFNQWQVGFPGPEFNFVNEQPFHILFKVVPGQISYIGNINLGLNFHQEDAPEFAITVYNFLKRDQQVFRNLYRKYQSLPIHERIATVEHHLDLPAFRQRWMRYPDYYEN